MPLSLYVFPRYEPLTKRVCFTVTCNCIPCFCIISNNHHHHIILISLSVMRAFQVLKINFTTSMVLHFYICHVYMHQSLCIDWNLHPILASINSHDGANLSLRLSFPFFSSHSRLYTRTSNYMTHPCSVAVVTLVIIVIIDWKLSFCNFLLVTFTGPSYVPPCSHFRME